MEAKPTLRRFLHRERSVRGKAVRTRGAGTPPRVRPVWRRMLRAHHLSRPNQKSIGGMSTVVRWYAETPTLGMPVPSGEGSEAVPVPLSGEAMPPYEIQDRSTLCGLPASCGRGTRPLGQRSARRAASPDPVRCRGCGLPRTSSSRHLGSLAVVPELSLTLWLLIRGVEVPQQEKEGLWSPLPRH